MNSRDCDEVLPTLKDLGMEDYSFNAVRDAYPDAFSKMAA
jgi:hypothetical protein